MNTNRHSDHEWALEILETTKVGYEPLPTSAELQHQALVTLRARKQTAQKQASRLRMSILLASLALVLSLQALASGALV